MLVLAANTMVLSALGVGVILLAAMALLAFGIRGRRTDDHPLCRRCGFDLFGKPAQSTRCSECGADLDARRAVRTGHRAKRPVAILLAMPLLLAGACSIGTLRWINLHAADAIHYLPVWWLVNDLNRAGGPTRDNALAELDRRLLIGKLPAIQVDRIVGRVLAVQGDSRLPWTPAWGDFIEHVHDRGGLADEHWQRYLRQTVTGGLKVRARMMLRRGEGLPLAIDLRPVRCGSTYRFTIGGSFTVRLGDRASEAVQFQDPDSWWPGRRGRFVAMLDSAAWEGISNGPQPARVVIAATVTAQPNSSPALTSGMFAGSPPASPSQGQSAPVAAPLTADLPEITVVAQGGAGVMLDTDASHRAMLAANVTAEFHPGAGCVLLDVHIPRSPVNIECDVLLRHGGQESRTGHISHSWTSGDTESFFIGRTAPLPCDVILRPVLKDVDPSDIYWGEPILLKNVQLVNEPVSLRQ